MELNESFWKEASKKIDDLFRNPIKLNNEDLLLENLHDSSFISTPSVLSKPKYKTKQSELNKKYTNYKPEIMTILQASKKLTSNKQNLHRTPSPFFKLNSKNIFQNTFTETYDQSLEIFGQRAGFFCLPKIQNPLKLKSFILKVKEKYNSLFKQLKDTDSLIRIEGIFDYLTRITNMKRCSPSVKISSRSESVMRRGRFSKIEKDYTNFIQEQGKKIMELFDPLLEGVVTSHNFFGIVGIFEYSCAGTEGISKSKFDLSSFKHVRFLGLQVSQLKSLFFKYKQSQLLEREALKQLFVSVKRMESCIDDIFSEIDLKKSANFGQFLSIIPLFLENYEEIMKNLD